MAPLIPFTFGVELEFLFAVNTDVVAQDPTHFLSPHTGLESSPASKTFCKTAVSPRPPNSLEGEVVGSSGSTTVNPAASCSTGADSKLFRAAEYVARIVRSHGQPVRIHREPHHGPNFKAWQITRDEGPSWRWIVVERRDCNGAGKQQRTADRTGETGRLTNWLRDSSRHWQQGPYGAVVG